MERDNKNVFERRAEELRRYKRIDEVIYPEDQVDIKAKSLKKAPYVSITWIERFLDLNHRQVIDRVDTEFVRLNIVGSGNESKVISALQFLHLIDESGRATQKLALLRVLGDDFRNNLKKVVTDAYSDLISTVVLEAARPENLINFFVQRYGYSPAIAKSAANLFLWFSQQAGISISEELKTLGTETYAKTVPRSQSAEKIVSKPKIRTSLENAFPGQETTLTATVNIYLDKDTPREFWDRVLALLGEKKKKEDQDTK
jgi:hypothetical protein